MKMHALDYTCVLTRFCWLQSSVFQDSSFRKVAGDNQSVWLVSWGWSSNIRTKGGLKATEKPSLLQRLASEAKVSAEPALPKALGMNLSLPLPAASQQSRKCWFADAWCQCLLHLHMAVFLCLHILLPQWYLWPQFLKRCDILGVSASTYKWQPMTELYNYFKIRVNWPWAS